MTRTQIQLPDPLLTNEKDHEEMHRVEAALEEIMEETIRLGGTITSEHGVGLAKKASLNPQLAAELSRKVQFLLAF